MESIKKETKIQAVEESRPLARQGSHSDAVYTAAGPPGLSPRPIAARDTGRYYAPTIRPVGLLPSPRPPSVGVRYRTATATRCRFVVSGSERGCPAFRHGVVIQMIKVRLEYLPGWKLRGIMCPLGVICGAVPRHRCRHVRPRFSFRCLIRLGDRLPVKFFFKTRGAFQETRLAAVIVYYGCP